MKRKFKGLLISLAVCAVSAVAVMASGCNLTETIKQKIEQSRCEHTFDSGKELKAATCSSVGELEKTCTVCAYVTVESIPMTEHVSEDVEGKDATCTEAGFKSGKKCRVCDTVIEGLETIPVKGHNPVTDQAVKATCTTSGLTKGSHCDKCDEVFEAQQIIPATGHNIRTLVGFAPTCDASGKTDGYACSFCDFVLVAQEEIAKLGHDYDDGVIATKATCVDEGVMRYTCNTCGQVDNQSIAATGIHTVVTVNGYPATCTSAGLTNGQKCAYCDEVFSEREVIAATGHIFDNGTVKKAATCGTDGLMRYTCIDCGSVKDNTIKATGNHKIATLEGKSATCTETGLTSGQYCSVCALVITAQEETPIIDHIFDDGILQEAQNCLSNDIMTYTCTECGNTYSETLEKGPHADDNNDSVCDYCNKYFISEEFLQTATFTAVEKDESLNGWYRVNFDVTNYIFISYSSYVLRDDLCKWDDSVSAMVPVIAGGSAINVSWPVIVVSSDGMEIEDSGFLYEDEALYPSYSNIQGFVIESVGDDVYVYIPQTVTADAYIEGPALGYDNAVTISGFTAGSYFANLEKVTFNL